MILKLLRYLFNYSEREVRRQRATVERINALEPEIARLTDAELAAKTGIFKERLAKGEPIESLAAEAFAVVREAPHHRPPPL